MKMLPITFTRIVEIRLGKSNVKAYLVIAPIKPPKARGIK
tara:strand:- start:517 stop:636 length:120 start_codon:yes stop_codon:yes gene_type:complete